MARHSSSYWQDYPSTSTLARAVDYNDWEAAHDGAVGPLRVNPVQCKFKLAADLSLANNTNTQLTGWTQVSDKDGVFGSNAWTIPTASRSWRLKAACRFQGSAGGGYRYLYLILNSTTVSTASILAQDGGINTAAQASPGDYKQVSYYGPLSQGDVIRVFAVQSAGGALLVTSASQSANYGDTWFSLKDDGPA